MESIFTLEHFVSLVLLVALQAVLGLDNLLYISIVSKQAPADQQKRVAMTQACSKRTKSKHGSESTYRMRSPMLESESKADDVQLLTSLSLVMTPTDKEARSQSVDKLLQRSLMPPSESSVAWTWSCTSMFP